MNRFSQQLTYEDIRAMTAEEYARFQEAAKARAHVLRRDAVVGWLDAAGRLLKRGLENARRKSRRSDAKFA